MKREEFLRVTALMAGTSAITGFASVAKATSDDPRMYNAAQNIITITPQERKQRVARLQQLMLQNKMEALVLEGGTSLEYFTGISWWLSERLMAAVIPAKGEIIYICPGFEESRFQELISISGKVFVWQEDENPYAQVERAFTEAGIHAGKIGIEEQLRFFVFDGIRKAAPQMEYSDGGSVTIPCRMVKSAAELALMQQASDITVAAIKSGINALKEGISPGEIADIINDAHRKMGATPDFAVVLFGEASANPHGSIKPQRLKKGDIVLMDCGCKLEGYCSDITRTLVFGDKPTKRQRDIWDLE
ncbi:MAG: Xaa-Pro peptidase family protein, partial [Bacteroidota bacterium]|nr:Xaa-Pro peptidase family protein [Bacteroidota bacterium]